MAEKKGKANNRKASAVKAARAAARKRVFNLRRAKAVKEATKAVRALVAEKKAADAANLLPAAYQAIDKAVKRGVLKKNTAARMKSGLAKKVAIR